MNKREEVVTETKTWLKTPYRHYANIKGAGVDCAMLLIEVYSKCGLIEKFDPRPYPHDWHLHRSEEKYLNWVMQFGEQVETPLAGDVVLYKFGRCVSHGAIVIDFPLVIHSYISDGCVMAEGDRGMLGSRLHSFYKIKGIDK
jgi:cell wall-associated NlpC family hydrolase